MDQSDELERIQAWVNGQFDAISQIAVENYRIVLLCSLIDTFAQEYSNYSRKNQESFVKFLVTFGGDYTDFLSMVCPVTLYYDCFEHNDTVSLNFRQHHIYEADDYVVYLEAQRLLLLLPENSKRNAQEKHTYARLIYQIRNKLSHELKLPNMPINFLEDEKFQRPHMASQSKFENGHLTFSGWSLNIPENFIADVAKEAISNYLQNCKRLDHVPFRQNRKCVWAWYD